MTRCEDCVRCQRDGCDAIAFCLSQPGTHPCGHDGIWCEDCLDQCPDCRREMELEMYRTGEYSTLADPFVNTHASPPPDRIAENGGYWWDGSWVPVPKDAS